MLNFYPSSNRIHNERTEGDEVAVLNSNQKTFIIV